MNDDIRMTNEKRGVVEGASPNNGQIQRMLYRWMLWIAVPTILLGGVFIFLIRPAQRAACAASSRGSMFGLYIALLNYESVHGRFPPAYSTDENGNPLLSWRVHLLPYIQEEELYGRFDLTQPWDSTHNQQLLREMPDLYALHGTGYDPKHGYTAVAGVVGDESFFTPKGRKASEVSDAPETMLVLVEIPNGQIHWTEPRDLEFTMMSFNVADGERLSICGPTWRSPIVSTLDHASRLLDRKTPPEMVRAMLTVAGGEKVDESVLKRED